MPILRRLREIWLKEGHAPLYLAILPWVGVEPESSEPSPRWRGLVELGRDAKLALSVPTGTSVRYHVGIPPRAIFLTSIALADEGPAAAGGTVEFKLEVRSGDGSRARTWTQRLDAARNRGTWSVFGAPLAEFEGVEVDLTLSATAIGEGARDAVPLWGEPSLRSRRRPPEFAALARAYLALFGLRRAARKAVDLLLRPPFDHATDYDGWLHRHRPSAAELERQRREAEERPGPSFSLLLVADAAGAAHLSATLDSIRRQTYPRWQLCIADAGLGEEPRAALERAASGDARLRFADCREAPGSALAAALSSSNGDFVAPVGCGDQLAPQALHAIAAALRREPAGDVVYSDEDRIGADGRRSHPFFKPDWSPDYFVSSGYTRRLAVYRRAALDRIGGFRAALGEAQELDLLLRLFESGARIAHVEDILYHYRRRVDADGAGPLPAPTAPCQRAVREHFLRTGVDATCEPHRQAGLLRVRYALRERPLVSIVIPTGGRERLVGERRVDLVLNCIRSIVQRSSYANFEVLCIDDANLKDETRAGLEALRDERLRFLTFPRPLNLADKMNWGVERARGGQVVFLNDDIEVLSPDWLESLLEFSQQPEIGAVGAKLLFPSGAIQHGGMAVADRLPVILHRWYPGTHPGYFGNLLVPCNLSSLIGACLMTRRALFTQLGGFDEGMPFLWHDLDYCFKVRARNLRVVLNPYAELYHFETASKPSTFRSLDTVRMASLWRDALDRDPFYNRNLRQDRADFRVAP
jgi:O-antigen biosynthesis protein